MKHVRYGSLGAEHAERPGLFDSQGWIREPSRVIADIDRRTLSPQAIKMLSGLDLTRLPLITGAVRHSCTVSEVGKIVCVDLNYADHAAESGLPVPAEGRYYF